MAKEKKISLILCSKPIQLIPELVVILGSSDCAAIFQQVYYWLQVMEGKSMNTEQDKNGKTHTWIFNSYQDWHDQDFPWMSQYVIRIHFRHLEENGYEWDEDTKKWVLTKNKIKLDEDDITIKEESHNSFEAPNEVQDSQQEQYMEQTDYQF